jgi:hypothetical protein
MPLVLLVLSVGEGRAETIATMSASSYEAVPEAVAVRVRPEANSPVERDLVAVFEAAIKKAGREIDGRDSYTFSFRLTAEVERTRGRSRLQLEGQGGSRDADDLSLTMRWNALGRTSNQREDRPRLLLVKLADPQGHVVWEAKVAFKTRESDAFDDVSRVAPGVVAEIGHEVLGRRLP